VAPGLPRSAASKLHHATLIVDHHRGETAFSSPASSDFDFADALNSDSVGFFILCPRSHAGSKQTTPAAQAPAAPDSHRPA